MTATAIPELKESTSRPTGVGVVRRKRDMVQLKSSSRAQRRSNRRLASVWMLAAPLLAIGAFLAWIMAPMGRLGGLVEIPFWVLAPAFTLGEVAVVHLRFRKNAHSFSMSEVPLIVGLFSTFPLGLIVAQALGSFLAYTLHRKQTMVRVAFNVGQGAIVTSTTIWIFRSLATEANALNYVGWFAALIAVTAGVSIANVLVHLAIRISGGRNTMKEVGEVLTFTLMGAIVNTFLGLIFVMILWTNPSAFWLAVAPPVVLYVAYRAYVSQRLERARLQSLYEASRRLHSAPQIDRAVEIACNEAISMLDAERAEIVLFSEVGSRLAYRTVLTTEATEMTMFPVVLTEGERDIAGELAESPARVLEGLSRYGLSSDYEIKDGVSAPLVGSAGALGYLLVTNRLDDVSTFVDADARLLATLAGHVTVSLENGRLEDSLEELTRLKDQLEQEVKSKDEFVASVSHELRTPLTGIVGLSHELVANREYFEDEEVNDLLVMISEQSSELSNIVEDLLVGARADAGTLVIKPASIDLAKEIQAVVAGHALLGSDGHADVPVTMNANAARADALRFRQIVRNLLTNAARYGGNNVWIETHREAGRVVVLVMDDGRGVPVGQEAAIFEAYQRAHNAVGQPASVGLGLSVARKLARLMGGDLRYRRVNDTSVFELALPLVSQNVVVDKPVSSIV